MLKSGHLHAFGTLMLELPRSQEGQPAETRREGLQSEKDVLSAGSTPKKSVRQKQYIAQSVVIENAISSIHKICLIEIHTF